MTSQYNLNVHFSYVNWTYFHMSVAHFNMYIYTYVYNQWIVYSCLLPIFLFFKSHFPHVLEFFPYGGYWPFICIDCKYFLSFCHLTLLIMVFFFCQEEMFYMVKFTNLFSVATGLWVTVKKCFLTPRVCRNQSMSSCVVSSFTVRSLIHLEWILW